jgi:hypothetical protein
MVWVFSFKKLKRVHTRFVWLRGALRGLGVEGVVLVMMQTLNQKEGGFLSVIFQYWVLLVFLVGREKLQSLLLQLV